jgi:hypothetical protein
LYSIEELRCTNYRELGTTEKIEIEVADSNVYAAYEGGFSLENETIPTIIPEVGTAANGAMAKEKVAVCWCRLEEYASGSYTTLINFSRTNTIQSRHDVSSDVTPSIVDAKAPISAPVSRHGWIFFAAPVGGTMGSTHRPQRIRAYALAEMRDTWSGSPTRSAPLSQARLTAYPNAVLTQVNDLIWVDSALQGGEIARVETGLKNLHSAVINETLVVMGTSAQNQLVVQHHSLQQGYDTKHFTLRYSSASQNSDVEPIITDSLAYMVDNTGHIWICDGENSPQEIWNNPDETIVHQITLTGKQLHILVQHAKMYALLQIALDDKGFTIGEAQIKYQELPLALGRFAIHENRVFFAFQNKFVSYGLDRLFNPNQPIWEHSLVTNGNPIDFFIVVHEDWVRMVYLLHLSQPPSYSVRWVTCDETSGSSQHELQRLAINSEPCIGFSNGYVLSCERKNGKIYAKRPA